MKNRLKKLAYYCLCKVYGKKHGNLSLIKADGIDKYKLYTLMRIFKRHRVQAAAISYRLSDSSTHTLCFGSSNNIIIDENTYFRTASITKLFIAVLVLKFEEEGLLKIEDSISKYLNYPIENPKFKNCPISIEQILSHTSSIVDSKEYFAAMQEKKPFDKVLEYSNNKPSSKFEYSNLAFGLLEIALENISNKPLDKLLDEYIFSPYNIDACLYPSLDMNVADIYRIYKPSDRPNYTFDEFRYKQNLEYQNLDKKYRYLKAAGSIHITLKGISTFAQAMLKSMRAQDGGILSNASVLKLIDQKIKYPKRERRLYHSCSMLIVDDIRICPNKIYGHQGFAYGCVNGIFLDPLNNMYLVSLNSGAMEWRNGHFSCYTEDLLNYIYKNCEE